MDTAKEMLDALDTFFVSAPAQERCALWDILSTLRGPDALEGMKVFTVNIRRRAFPKVAKRHDTDIQNAFVPASFAKMPIPDMDVLPMGHFKSHIQWAREALVRVGR